MDLALLTLQRREDIVKMKFEDIKDGYLFVIQEKTKKHDTGYLKIEIGQQLGELLKRCRSDIPSPYVIHRRPIRKKKRKGDYHWTQISPEMVSRNFKSIRDSQVGMFDDYQDGEKPTFHEIRALGEKLYRDQGKDPKKLGGWASEKMVKNYDSGHSEIRWVDASADLKLSEICENF